MIATTTAFTLPHTAACSSLRSLAALNGRHAQQQQQQQQQEVNTRLYVGSFEKWELPNFMNFDTGEEGEGVATKNDNRNEAKSVIKVTQPPLLPSPPPFISHFFQKDTAEEAQRMEHLVELRNENDNTNLTLDEPEKVIPFLVVGAVVLAVVGANAAGIIPADLSLSDITSAVQTFFQDPTSSMEMVTEMVADMGPLGPLYFGLFYTFAEVLAIPAIPLTASAGYLFGVSTGTLVVLVSASIAASISFGIGRTLLRTTVENAMKENPDFKKMDKAIGREGFKLMLLLRLSPLFPFALSNYLYGATSIDFASFFWGTLCGFAPGTLAYVYTGVVGKALTIGGDGVQPWYVYVGGAALLGGLLKIIVDVASNIVREIEDEEAEP